MMVAACAAAAADPTDGFRRRFAIPGTLEVLSATVDDGSSSCGPGGGPVASAVRCRLDRPGTYTFAFDPWAADGKPEQVTVRYPAPTDRLASVRPGGIHGGPPRATSGAHGPTAARDGADPAVVTVRWVYGGPPGDPARYGVRLARCDFAPPPATRPTTVPAAGH